MISFDLFTPVFDTIVQKYGPVTAVVLGAIWRYAQGNDKVCWASQSSIAERVHVSRRTVIRSIQVLENDGWVTRLPSPDGVTLRLQVNFQMSLAIQGTVEITPPVTESHTPVTESHTPCDTESHKDTIKETNKDTNTGGTPDGDAPEEKKPKYTGDDRVKLYRKVVHRWPNAYQQSLIVDKVSDMDLWEYTLMHWMSHGWSPVNVNGMLDMYHRQDCTCGRYAKRTVKPKAMSPEQIKAQEWEIYHASNPNRWTYEEWSKIWDS